VTEVIKMEHIRKVYDNGFLANDDISFSLNSGEIHAIAGENGAGKSTLMKLLYGVEKPTSGKIYIKGVETKIYNPSQSIKLGIGMVFQHFMLVDELTIFENIFLGNETAKFNILLKDKMKKKLEVLSEKFNFKLDINAKCGTLSVSQKQKVEILKVLSKDADVFIFDEPTAVLTAPESDELFEQLRLLRKAGHTVVIITHKLQEIKVLCDRVTVLRKGRNLGTYDVSQITTEEISRLMVGFDVKLQEEITDKKIATDSLLEVKDLVINPSQETRPISFNVHRGEIVCVTGVEGSGQEKVIEMLMGLTKVPAGTMIFNNHEVTHLSLKSRRELGMSYIPADRMVLGTNLNSTVFENIAAHDILKTSPRRLGFFDKRYLKKAALKHKDEYSIKTSSMNQSIHLLSGGNIQKVVTAREMENDPLLLIAEHPTRGVDVGTMELIFNKMRNLKKAGKSIFLVSTDWNEMMALADRIIIFFNNEMTAIIDEPRLLNEYDLGYYMLGVKRMVTLV